MAKAKQAKQEAIAEKPIPEESGQAPTAKELRVTSTREGGFRRAGIRFGKESVTLNVEDLTQEQIDQIIQEPMLTSVWVLASE